MSIIIIESIRVHKRTTELLEDPERRVEMLSVFGMKD